MATNNKLEEARREGISFAVRFLENAMKQHNSSWDSIELLKEEAKERGAYNIPIGISKKQADELCARAKRFTVDSMIALGSLVLRDEFDFGGKRISRFVKRLESKSECITEGRTTWRETLGILSDECGVNLQIRCENGAIITVGNGDKKNG